MRRDMLLDLVLNNKEGLLGDVKVGGSDHERVELKILHRRGIVISRIAFLDFRRANFGLLKIYLEVPHRLECKKLRGPMRAGWHLNTTSFQAQDWCIPKNQCTQIHWPQ